MKEFGVSTDCNKKHIVKYRKLLKSKITNIYEFGVFLS